MAMLNNQMVSNGTHMETQLPLTMGCAVSPITGDVLKKKCSKGHGSLMKIFKGPFWQSFATFIMPKIFKN